MKDSAETAFGSTNEEFLRERFRLQKRPVLESTVYKRQYLRALGSLL